MKMLGVQAGTRRFLFLKSENTKQFWGSELAAAQPSPAPVTTPTAKD